MTPEGRIKKNIQRVLDAFGVYSFMPVQSGFGKRGVDYHCCARYGDLCLAFFVEAKRPGEDVTPIQRNFLAERRAQNAKTFVIDDDNVTLRELVKWLEEIEAYNERHDTTQHGREFLANNL